MRKYVFPLVLICAILVLSLTQCGEINDTHSSEDLQNIEYEEENNSFIDSNMVWISESGEKYHSDPDCSNMKDPEKITREKAEEMGRTPCKKCY